VSETDDVITAHSSGTQTTPEASTFRGGVGAPNLRFAK
jgi:hypothetical protein